MNEFIEKTIDKAEEKIKVTSLEIIVTGTKDKLYFEIKYKEVGKDDYTIGYSSYDLNNVFDWKEDCFEIVNELAEEYNGGWIPTSEREPDEEGYYLITHAGNVSESFYRLGCWFDSVEHYYVFGNVTAWQPLPKPYQPKGE